MKPKILRFLERGVEYSIYGMLFFIPISITIIGIFASLAICLFLLKKILSPDISSIKANKMLFLLLFVFFVFMDLSLLNSGPLVGKSLKALLIKWGRFPLLLWAIIDTFKDTKRVIRAGYVILFGATLVGATVFSQKFFGFEFVRRRTILDCNMPATGPFKNANALAAYLTCVFPIVLSFALSRWKKIFVKLCFILITAMLLVSSFWTASRGGWLGLISGLIFVALVTNYQRIKKVFWPLFFLSYVFFVPLFGLALLFYRNRWDASRLIFFEGAWKMIKENPVLGKGVGVFMDYSSRYMDNLGVCYAHNCYLQMWAESGFFSLLFFLLFVGYVFYKSIKVILGIPKPLGYFTLIGLTAGLLGFLVHSSFEVHLYSFQLSFLFWAVLGLTVVLCSRLKQESGGLI